MQISKSTLLPILGMVVLVIFITLSYINGAIFLDRILICSFILSIVFIAKLRESLNRNKEVQKNNPGRPLFK